MAFDASSIKPGAVPQGEAGSEFSPPQYRVKMGTPSTPETQERVRSFSENVGEFLFGTPSREEFSGTEAALTTGVTSGMGYAAPTALKYGGKLVSAIPTAPTKSFGMGMQLAGEVLGKLPASRRALTGAGSGLTLGVTEQAGEYLGIPRVVTLPASFLTSAAGGYTADLLYRATGLEAKALAREVRDKGVQITEDMLRKAGLSKQEAENEILRLNKIQQQLAEREGVATKRAEARQTSPMEAERQKVLEDVAAARVRAQESARIAGATEQQAAQMVALAEKEVIKAKQAVDNLEGRLVAMPNMSKEDFGKLLQSTTQNLYNDGQAARKAAADFKGIIQRAGDAPTVSTQAMFDSLEDQIARTGNPTVRQVLKSIQNEISLPAVNKIDGKVTYSAKPISLAKADSLKGYIDNIINSKQFGETKLSKEILNQVRKTKSGLFESIRASHPDYMDALGAFRDASRPLDIVERNGALAKVIERDPLSTEYKMKEAEIVGYILNKAKAGNRVFERLIEKNPGVQDAARLYFVKDLFGKEVAPTEAVVRNWLKSNESVLRRTGLYDEFKNMATAQRTAKKAVDEAKDVLEIAKAGEKGSKKFAAQAEKEATKASSLQERAEKRLEETLKAKEPIEDILKRSAARAKPAETKVAQRLDTAEREVAKQETAERAILTLQDDLYRMKPKDMLTRVKSMATDLSEKGVISPAEADALKRQIDLNQDKFKSSDEAIKTLKWIAGGLGITALAGKVFAPSDVVTGR